ncbi:MAG: 50S ribosomal protein L13 [Verrucomicrobia bacterium]|nr:50S ribosomal protein L13 [Verrucomicrobiota bacterium]
MKTTLVKQEDVNRKWHVVDAADKPTGRLAVEIANVLRGKNKPTFAPHIDTGDFVIVVNAEKIKLSGAKNEQKIYQDFTGYPSGLKETKAAAIREKHPERIITQAVKGMLPKNRLSRQIITRLKVYAGPEHPHAAQQPEVLELTF